MGKAQSEITLYSSSRLFVAVVHKASVNLSVEDVSDEATFRFQEVRVGVYVDRRADWFGVRGELASVSIRQPSFGQCAGPERFGFALFGGSRAAVGRDFHFTGGA